ncbi:hypothetical protein KIN20_006478 [Parelaphostrongylus tenuis]|uniref:Uncharacterized protein n=1 Tax=Parelaphostrongylus tenuis TaxID=148309 RepID=A0AAD5M1U2_PARTN|nr:hypothetical protein KIN20_006478 [Parelaphostrongylus tenuis]
MLAVGLPLERRGIQKMGDKRQLLSVQAIEDKLAWIRVALQRLSTDENRYQLDSSGCWAHPRILTNRCCDHKMTNKNTMLRELLEQRSIGLHLHVVGKIGSTTAALSSHLTISGTAGWYRECDIIPHTRDVDFAALIENYNPNLLTHLQSNETKFRLTRKFGRVNDSYEFTLQPLGGGRPSIDLFWMYSSENDSWVGGTARDGSKFKYTYPRMLNSERATWAKKNVLLSGVLERWANDSAYGNSGTLSMILPDDIQPFFDTLFHWGTSDGEKLVYRTAAKTDI